MKNYCKLKSGVIGAILSENQTNKTIQFIELGDLQTTCSRFIKEKSQDVKEDDIAVIDTNLSIVENYAI